MNLAELLSLESSGWWGPAVLLIKLTGLLLVAWGVHALLAGANPRWRVVLWRVTAAGILSMACLTACPPLMTWRVLPAVPSDSVSIARADGPTHAIRSGVPPQGPGPGNGIVTTDRAPRDSFDVPSGLAVQADERATSSPPDAGRPAVVARPKSAAADTQSRALLSSVSAWAAIWGVVVLALATRTACGLWRLRALLRNAVVSPESIQAQAVALARRLGYGGPVRVRQTNAVTAPCLAGLWPPTILLPATRDEATDDEELSAVLAHEIAHLQRHDVGWNVAWHVLGILFWFHPLVWRVRRVHADACDAVADAVAADYVGSADIYGRTLARIAVRTHEPSPVAALAMARTSHVRQRIESLQRRVFRDGLPRRRALFTIASALLLSVAVGGGALARFQVESQKVESATATAVRDSSSQPTGGAKSPTVTGTAQGMLLVQADATAPAAANPQDQPEQHTLTVSAVADATGEPLKGVKIRFNGSIAGKRYDQRVETDEQGMASVQWARGATVNNLWMDCKFDGFVPMNYVWRSDATDIQMPERIDLRFMSGRTIAGVVQDETGNPIAGVDIEITMPLTFPERHNWVFTAAELKTDEHGHWTWPSAPRDLGLLGIRLSHPDYMDGFSPQAAASVAILKRGLQVSGRVVDGNGKPIAGAKAQTGTDRWGTNEPEATSDADGRFIIKKCKPGKSLVTVHAEGFSPQFRDVHVGDGGPTTDVGQFQLEPGHTLRVRVVDAVGRPVKRAFFAADTWRGYRTINFRVDTDAEGRVVWNNTPPDPVLCDIGKHGYMSVRKVSLQAGDKEHVITLPPLLTVHGTVVDASTRQPIPQFGVRHGFRWNGETESRWSDDVPVEYANGEFSYRFNEPIVGAYLLQAVAPGYLPASSRPIRSDEGNVTLEFALQTSTGLSGMVVDANGRAVAKASVGLATREQRGFLSEGYFDRRQNHAPVVETNDAGKFEFPPQEQQGPFLLIALHDSGFAEVTEEEFAKSFILRLTPWGQVNGQVLRGTRPDADCEVTLWPERPQRNGGYGMFVSSYGYTTRTDDRGRFQFTRVIPGKVSVARVVVSGFGRFTQHATGWGQRIDLKPNETANVTIGGTGQPVVGRVELNRQPELPVDWTTNGSASLSRVGGAKDQAMEDSFSCLGNLDRNGRFEIPDVPPGDYCLSIPVNNPPVLNSCGPGTAIGMATYNFTVPQLPGGRSDEPLDLGVIQAVLFDTLDPGELAPDFVAERLLGGQFRLSESQGKVVVLDFWATWCAPCVGEFPALAELYNEFKTDDRFRLVSVSCDNDIRSPRELLAGKGYDWNQAFVPGMYGSPVADYTVRALPGLFLIGPDGRVLAKNLRGSDLRGAVAAALKNEELFKSAATAVRPPRFPVTHFEPDSSATLTELPAVVVLDDSDPIFTGDRHTDALRLLSADGRELKVLREFNNCEHVGGTHRIAIDHQRGRFFFAEVVAKRVHCFDRHGRRLWQVEHLEADALAVDPATGNVWCTGGPMLNQGETIVLDEQGREVAAFPLRGVDLQYDSHSDCFWMVGYRILKMNRQGDVLFEKPVEGWCCPSLTIEPASGSVWFIERDHQDVAKGRDRLWKLNADGSVAVMHDLDKQNPFAVECDPESGVVWVATLSGGLLKFHPDGSSAGKVDIKARNLAWGRGALWAFTETALLKLDAEGTTQLTVPIDPPSRQGWLAVFNSPGE